MLFPIGCDDPLSDQQTGQLVVDFYNGAKGSTVKHGDLKPQSTAVVSANFTITAKARYEYCNFRCYSFT